MTRWTWHGGGLEAARRHFGAGDWLDLSTGINPHPWPAASVAIDWHRLPEPESLATLEAAAAGHFGCESAHVCAVPGTEVALRLVGQLIGGPARHRPATYRTHAEMISGAQAGALGEDTRGTLILANPNNPDGQVLSRESLLALLASRAKSEWLLLDEAFGDTEPALSLAADVGEGRRLVVFRSFGKFFGLAGLRLGFVGAEPSLLARLAELLGPWSISGPAQIVGKTALADRAWQAAMRDRLAADGARLRTLLAHHGVQSHGTDLFQWWAAGDPVALHDHLARQHIWVRLFPDAARGLRLGLPAVESDWARLDLALAGFNGRVGA